MKEKNLTVPISTRMREPEKQDFYATSHSFGLHPSQAARIAIIEWTRRVRDRGTLEPMHRSEAEAD